jgi:hypothetical protein
MSVIHPPFTVRCGDTWEFSGPIYDDYGNLLNLTGAQFVWRIDTTDMKTNILTTVSGLQVFVTNLATSTVEYYATSAQTAAIPPGSYYDTLRVTLADGVTGFTVIEGVINASPIPA